MNGCQYSQATFTLPAGPANVSQEEWDRIFKSPKRKNRIRKLRVPEPEEECCGCDGCGIDCGCLCS
jgi:hypothetical protein